MLQFMGLQKDRFDLVIEQQHFLSSQLGPEKASVQ